MKRASLLLFVLLLVPAIVLIAATDEDSKSVLSKEQYIPDIATFMQIGYCSPAGYSWDGDKVFFTSSMSGSNQVYRINDEGWPYQLTTFEDGIDFFSLSYSSELGIVGASVGGSEQSDLYLMDTRTGRVEQLTFGNNVQYGSVMWDRTDRYIFFRSNEENGRDFFIYRLDVTTGDYEKVFGDTTEVQGYLVPADLSQDGRYMIVYQFTSNVNNDLYMVDLQDGSYQKLTEDDKDVSYYSPTLMPDNQTIWLTCNDNPDGTTRLAKMTVGDPAVEFVDDGWLDPQWEVAALGVSRDYTRMTAFQNVHGYVRMFIRDLESGEELPSPPLDGIVGGGFSDEHGNYLLSFSSATQAPNVWRYSPTTGELEQMTFATYAGIDREVFSEPELVSFESFDGLEIPAFLYLPPNYKKGEKIPFIVHAHGGPESQFQPAFIRNFQYLILNGYGIIAVNPRGSSGYGREYLNLDNYKNRKHSLYDYKAAVDWLIENGYTEEGKLGIRGGSYGGYVVMGMITEYPDLFNAAVNVVGIVNFKTFLENTAEYRRALRESEYGPLSDPEFLKDVSPIHKAADIKTPLLVIHGENDPRVPVSEARQIIAAVRDNGGIVDSLIFPDEGHGASKRVNVIAEYRKQVEFFNRHLKQEQGMQVDGEG